jgi:hypothetical protein
MRPGVRQAEFEASAEEVEAERLWRVERWHDGTIATVTRA